MNLLSQKKKKFTPGGERMLMMLETKIYNFLSIPWGLGMMGVPGGPPVTGGPPWDTKSC